MKSRTFIRVENLKKGIQHSTGQILATNCRFWLEDRFPRTLYSGPHAGETGRTTAVRQFDCKLDREYGETSAQPERRRNLAIRWVETDEMLLEINANMLGTRAYSSDKESSAE